MKFFISIFILFGVHETIEGLLENMQVRPPKAKHGYVRPANYKNSKARPGYDPDSIWEQSGLFQGDIITYNAMQKNGILDPEAHWSNATVPFYIEEKYFSEDEVKVILEAISEYHKFTCIRFKPYQEGDENFVTITGEYNGCWSSVGMQPGGQELNLHPPKCVRKGVAMHELLHAVGFFHEQSASNRDDYVKIFWDNIQEGHENNFVKHNESEVSAYGTDYDYKSIMHYSKKAFSKNGENTIQAIDNPKMELGQRKGFTKTDISKLNQMYQDTCNEPEQTTIDTVSQGFFDAVDWFSSLVNNRSRMYF